MADIDQWIRRGYLYSFMFDWDKRFQSKTLKQKPLNSLSPLISHRLVYAQMATV